MTASKPAPSVVHGWTLFANPLFIARVESLAQQVEYLRQKDPAGHIKKNATKRLATIAKLAFDVIPQDPTKTEYGQGYTLGDNRKHWFGAKFFSAIPTLFSIPRRC